MNRRNFLGLATLAVAGLGTQVAFAADGDVRIALTGAGGKGSAKYRNRRGVREFEVEAENLRVPAGTILIVMANGLNVGMMVTSAVRTARLNLDTQRGQAVPVIVPGSVVAVVAPNGAIVMGGRF